MPLIMKRETADSYMPQSKWIISVRIFLYTSVRGRVGEEKSMNVLFSFCEE